MEIVSDNFALRQGAEKEVMRIHYGENNHTIRYHSCTERSDKVTHRYCVHDFLPWLNGKSVCTKHCSFVGGLFHCVRGFSFDTLSLNFAIYVQWKLYVKSALWGTTKCGPFIHRWVSYHNRGNISVGIVNMFLIAFKKAGWNGLGSLLSASLFDPFYALSLYRRRSCCFNSLLSMKLLKSFSPAQPIWAGI